jgi:hypothetical protein
MKACAHGVGVDEDGGCIGCGGDPFPVTREHDLSEDCWCGPVTTPDGVCVHRGTTEQQDARGEA